MPKDKLIRILFYFSLNVENGIIAEILEISKKTVNTIVLKLQEKLSQRLSDLKIGGHGHIVQLDECCFGKRKYNVGRNGNQTWVFGGIDIIYQKNIYESSSKSKAG